MAPSKVSTGRSPRAPRKTSSSGEAARKATRRKRPRGVAAKVKAAARAAARPSRKRGGVDSVTFAMTASSAASDRDVAELEVRALVAGFIGEPDPASLAKDDRLGEGGYALTTPGRRKLARELSTITRRMGGEPITAGQIENAKTFGELLDLVRTAALED